MAYHTDKPGVHAKSLQLEQPNRKFHYSITLRMIHRLIAKATKGGKDFL